jgi:uncharacterized membrane protein
MTHHPLPQPDEIPIREKEDAMGAYLMMFAAVAIGLPLPIINLIAAIIYYFVNRKKSRFVHFHSLQALLSQVPTTLINWGLVVWAIWIAVTDLRLSEAFWSYAILAGVATLFYFVVSMIAAYKARQGKMYYFLFFGKIAYDVAYRVRPEVNSTEPINKPPF